MTINTEILFIVITCIISFCIIFFVKKLETEGKIKTSIFYGFVKVPGIKIISTPFDKKFEVARTASYIGVSLFMEALILKSREIYMNIIYINEVFIIAIGIFAILIAIIPIIYIYIIKYEYIREHVE